MTIKQAKLSSLTPDNRNANAGTERGTYMLDYSLRNLGAGRSILIDKEGRIIAGNKTAEAAGAIGLDDVIIVKTDGKKLVAVQRTDLDLTTDEEARLMAYADNRVSEVGFELDVEELQIDIAEGLDLSGLFTDIEIDEMFPSDEETPGSGAQVDKAEVLLEKWKVERGQIWQCGQHRVMCGDSTSAEDVGRLMGGEKAALFFTDPPYGISIVGNNGKIGASNLAENQVYAPVENDDSTDTAKEAWRIAREVCQESIIWGGNYFTDFLTPSSCWIVWDKREGMTSNNFADCELAWTSFQSPARIYRHLWSGMIRKGDDGKKVHPTQKPTKLHQDILNDFTKEGDLILDSFLGSGTLIVAAENTGRVAYGLEKSERYVSVILERLTGLGLEPHLVDG